MVTPATVRVAGGPGDGYVATSGVSVLRRMFASVESASEFEQWSKERTTMLVRDALRDLALNGPAHVDAEGAAVQYGVSVGLNLALQLVTDPSLVYPELFTGVSRTRASAPIRPDFSTSIEDMLDRKDRKESK